MTIYFIMKGDRQRAHRNRPRQLRMMWTEVINTHFSRINIWRDEDLCIPLHYI